MTLTDTLLVLATIFFPPLGGIIRHGIFSPSTFISALLYYRRLLKTQRQKSDLLKMHQTIKHVDKILQFFRIRPILREEEVLVDSIWNDSFWAIVFGLCCVFFASGTKGWDELVWGYGRLVGFFVGEEVVERGMERRLRVEMERMRQRRRESEEWERWVRTQALATWQAKTRETIEHKAHERLNDLEETSRSNGSVRRRYSD